MHAPPNPLVIVDHIGIAVRSLERAIDDWGRLFGYRQVTEIVVNTRQKVRVVFLRKDASIDIKLIEPTDETSPIYGFTARGGGLHHLCFRCDDVDAELARLNALGARTLRPPEPG